MDFTSKGHIWNKTNKTKHLPNNVKHLISRFINFLPMTSFESALPWSTAIVTMIMHLPRQYKACILKTQQALLPQVQFCWQPRSLSPRNSSLLSRVLNCCISWHTYPPPPTTPPPHLTFSISTALFCCVSVWQRYCDLSMKLVPGCWALYKSTVIINYFRNCYIVYAQCCFKSIFLNQNKCHQNSSHPAVTLKFTVTFNAFPKPRQTGGGGGGGGAHNSKLYNSIKVIHNMLK